MVAAAAIVAGCSSTGTATTAGEASTTTTSAPSADPLVASFDIDVDYDTTRPTSCPVESITFTDTSEGEPTGWAWELPDGSSSTEPSPVLTASRNDLGDGTTTLTVTRGDQTDSTTEKISFVTC